MVTEKPMEDIAGIICLILHYSGSLLPEKTIHQWNINRKKLLNSRFVCAVIRTGLQRRKSVLILFLESERQDKFPVTTFCPSIVLYGKHIRCSTSEYFPIKVCSLHLYDRVIMCHNTWGDMSAMPSMSQHLNDNMHGTSSTFIHMCQLTLNCLRAKYERTI